MYQFETIIDKESPEECQAKGDKLVEVLQSVYG